MKDGGDEGSDGVMDEWMDGWMDGWTDGWGETEQWMDGTEGKGKPKG